MNLVRFIISILLPAAAGYVVLCGEETVSRAERMYLSFTIGTGLLAFYLFVLVLLDIPFSLPSLLPFFTLFLIIGSLRWNDMVAYRPATPAAFFPDRSTINRIAYSLLLLLIAWKILFTVFIVLSGPTLFSDAYTTWNFKAKVIYYGSAANMPTGGGIVQGPFPHYPLHLPIMRAWIAFCIGHWDDRFANLHSVVLFICLLGMVHAFLKKTIGRMRAMIFTWILSGIPLLVNNVLSGYADMAVGYFFLASAVLLYYWKKSGKGRFLVFSGILVSMAMFTKLEGVAIVFPAILATVFYHLFSSRYSWKHIVANLGLFIISSAFIVLWLKDSHALDSLIAISGIKDSAIAFHPEGILPLMKDLFVTRNYNLFWFGFAALMVMRGKALCWPEARFFLLPGVLSLCAVLFIFLFTPNIRWLLDGTAINRTMLIIIPLLTVSSGLLFAPERS